MLQSSESDKQPGNNTDNINKLNTLIQMSTKNEGGNAGQQQQQQNANNNQNYNPNLIGNYNDN